MQEDQDYKGCLQKRIGNTEPRAENVGDKVLSKCCESRNNHQHAVVVQDLATQWIQSYPRENETSVETEKSLRKFLEPTAKPHATCTDDSLECGKVCEVLSWGGCATPPHRSETWCC